MLQIYQNIKRIRREKGITQADLAKKIGYTDRSTIAKVEAGIVDLTQSKIMAFAEALGVSASDLMGYGDTIEDLPPLRPDEAELLDLYNSTSPEGQQAILEVVKTIISTFK